MLGLPKTTIFFLTRNWLFVIALLICLPPMRGQIHDYFTQIKELDAYIEKARSDWAVPGLAVAVVKDGRTLLLKGYGVRSMSLQEPVDTNTLFAICSTTKAMTAATMSMLIDAGKLDWDDPVIEYLPEFQLHDPYITRSLRIRDLFTHNSGIGNADFLWYLWHHDPDELLYRMRYLPASYPLRGGYTYQNIMYAAAGKIIAKLSETPWEDFVTARIFQPLGMKHTFANQKRSMRHQNRSTPHYHYDDEIREIPDGTADLIAPAGAVWSTIADMSRWLHFLLDSAMIDQETLVSRTNYQEWFKPQVIVSDQGFYPTQRLTKPHWKTYGLGWFQHDFQGRAIQFHTGSLQGTVAIIGVIPDERLGVYVFGNLDHAEVRHAIMYQVFDLFGRENSGRDWSKEIKELYDKKKKQTQQVKEPSPLVHEELNAFQGQYTNQFLGDLKINLKKGQLQLHIGDVEHALLRPIYQNIFSVKSINRPWTPDRRIQFMTDGEILQGLRFLGYEFSKTN